MAPMKADASWMPEFRAKYAVWLPQAKPFMEEGKFADAFKTYPFPRLGTPPWAAVRKPLSQSRVAFVSTGGIYRTGADKPFDAESVQGDVSFRVLPRAVRPGEYAVAHHHIPHQVALEDLNTVLPLGRVEELIAEGVVGDLAPSHYSFIGYCPPAADLAEQVAPAIAGAMVSDKVDLAVVVPI